MRSAINLRERMDALQPLIEKAAHLQDIIEFLSDDLDGASPIKANEGIAFIWRNLMESQILTLTKIITRRENEKLSLAKIINCGEATQKGFRDQKFNTSLDRILQDFQRYQLDEIRDDFVAHSGITDAELRTNTHRLMIVKNKALMLFNEIAEFIGTPQYNHQHQTVDSLQKALGQI